MTGSVRPHYSSALIALVLGLGSILVLLTSLGIEAWKIKDVPLAYAANGVRYVAPSGIDNSNTCTDSSNPCATIQHTVDVANPGDEIRVSAWTYTGVSARAGITQMVYISKSVTIQGGYTTTNWTTPDPVANPTTLDAQGQGRVLYITGEISPTVAGLHITGGDAGQGGAPAGIFGGGGGGVFIITATAIISDNKVFSNTGQVYGGGLVLWDSDSTLMENSVISNSAGSAGGGLLLQNSNALVKENIISLNTTGGSGGGLIVGGSNNSKLSENSITENTAVIGGGLTVESSQATLIGNIVMSNSAVINPVHSFSGRGGGFHLLGSTATLSNNTITGNVAEVDGGGVYLEDSQGTLIGNMINYNLSDYSGGGVAAVDSSAVLSQNTIAANSAGGSGGGVLLSQYDMSGDITLKGNTIISNTAGEFGGGATLWGTVTMTNNIVTDNQANIAGSGLVILGGSAARLVHTTIARNSGGDGAGILIFSGSADLTNTILVSQTVGITVTVWGAAMMEATLWGSGSWANGADWAGAGSVVTGTINIWGDPAFVAPEAGDYHLSSASAAIGEAVDVGVTIDIDGETRDFFPDLGADEFSYQPLIWPVNGYSIYQSDPLRAHLENHPNGDLYDIYLEDAISNSYMICADVSTNSQNGTDPDPDCDISTVPPGLYDLYSTVAGSSSPRLSTAPQQVAVVANGAPQIVVKGGNIWAAKETTEISLLFHLVFADGPFDVKLYDGAGVLVQNIAIGHSGISFDEISWTVPDLKALGFTLCDLSSGKNCNVKSYKADGSLAAEVAVNVNQPKIILSSGLGPYAQGEIVFIYLKAHTPDKQYNIRTQNSISPSISATLITAGTNAAGDTTKPWIIPMDCGPLSGWPDGLYEITSYPLGLMPQLAILENVKINTPTTPYITVAGGYVWPAGSFINIKLHKHVSNTTHYLEFNGEQVGGPVHTFFTDGCGEAVEGYSIPATTSPGIYSITSFLESSQAQVASRKVTVSGQSLIYLPVILHND